MSVVHRVVGIAWLTVTLVPLGACNRDVKQRRFASPEEAAAAFTQAAERFDRQALVEILGSEGKSLIFSKDSVQDRQRALAFASEARIERAGEKAVTVTRDQMREHYAPLFRRYPNSRVRLLYRFVVGDCVVAEELTDGCEQPPSRTVAIYVVKEGLIVQARFLGAEK